MNSPSNCPGNKKALIVRNSSVCRRRFRSMRAYFDVMAKDDHYFSLMVKKLYGSLLQYQLFVDHYIPPSISVKLFSWFSIN